MDGEEWIIIMKKIVAYTISIFLLLSYLVILFLAMNPKVSDEYRMFYIDRTLKYYIKDGGLKNFKTNQWFMYNSSSDSQLMNMGTGWSNPEENVTWTNGNESVVYFYLDSNPNGNYTFKIEYIGNTGYDYYLCINDNKKIDLKDEDSIMYTKIDATYLKEGLNKISIITDDDMLTVSEMYEGSTDTRKLGLYVAGVILENN